MNKWLTISILVICFISVLVFRFILPWGNVYQPEGIQLNTVDAYWQIRYADVYTDLPEYDYYLNYPVGNSVPYQLMLPGMISGFADHLGLDNKTVAAWLPPLFFILSLLFFYNAVVLLFNKKVAILALLIVCFIPGQLLNRTMLGAGDHHALEILFMSMIVYLAAALIRCNEKSVRILAGVTLLGVMILFMFAWQGALLAVFIIGFYTWLQIVLHLNKLPRPAVTIPLFCAVTLICVGFFCISDYFPRAISMFTINQAAAVNEEYPLFLTNGTFDITVIYNEYGVGFFFALVGLGILAYQYYKRRDGGVLFFLVLTLIMLGITLARRRFTYYLSFEVAVLIAYAIYYFFWNIFKVKANRIKLAIAVFLVLAIPLGRGSAVLALDNTGYMSDGWKQATAFLYERKQADDIQKYIYEFGGQKIFNTLSWIESRDSYYTGERPTSGVLSWWDSGYWIVTESHLPVLCSPGAGNRELAAQVLTSETDKTRLLRDLQLRYIIISYEMLTKQAYNIFQKAGYEGPLENTLMYRLYMGEAVPGYKQIMVSDNNEVKVFILE